MRVLVLATTLLLALLAAASAAEARPLPPATQGCVGKPDVAQACITNGIGGTCIGVGVSWQGAYACSSGPNGPRVCTSAYTALWGYCVTDLLSPP